MDLTATELIVWEWLIHSAVIIGFLLAVILVGHILLQPRSPSGTLAWLLAIILIPWVAVPLYLAIGGRKTRRMAARKRHLDFTARAGETVPSPVDDLLRTYGFPPAYAGHRVVLCRSGEEIYASLVELIANATKSIYISTFIFRTDAIGTAIRDMLIKKAAEGLDVRVLLDGVGSIHTSRRFLFPLVKAGGRCAFFMPVIGRPFRGRTNLRNHRKIIIADGVKVLAGGTNIGEEYIGPTPLATRWCDLSFTLEGPAVTTYNEVFLSDWLFASGDEKAPELLAALPASEGGTIVQVIPSGPDVPNDAFYDAIVTAVFAAQKRLWIATPYFVLDNTLAQAITIAARRGVDVRIILPARSNHLLADMVRGEHLRAIQRSGGLIMLYTPRMMHAKVLLADDDFGIIGSANIDLRSLLLNYEIAMLLYSPDDIDALAEWMGSLMQDCVKGIEEASLSRRLIEGMLRTLAPLV